MRSIVATLAAALLGGAVAQQLPTSCVASADDQTQFTATSAQLLECLGAVTWDFEARRACTVDLLMHQLGQVYGFTGLQRDSKAAKAWVSEPFRDVVVPYESHLGPEIDALAAELKAEPSMGMFAYKVSSLVKRFNDAHTAVNFNALGWECIMPFDVQVGLNDDGAQAAFINNIKSVPYYYENAAWASFAAARGKGTEVITINNRPAIEYLSEVAASKGTVKDAGVAFNMFLRSQSLAGPVLPPDDGVFNFVLADGTEYKTEWRCARPQGWNRNLESMQSQFADSDQADQAAVRYGLLAEMNYEMFCDEIFDQTEGRRLSGDAEAPPRSVAALYAHDAKRLARRRQQAQSAGSSERKWLSGDDSAKARRRMQLDDFGSLPLQGNEDTARNFTYQVPDCRAFHDQVAAAASELKGGTISTAELRALGARGLTLPSGEKQAWKFCQLGAPVQPGVSTVCSVLGLLGGPGDDATIVLKIPSFGGGDNADTTGKYYHNVACAQAAVDVAQAIGGGKLMIDVIGNGGGSIAEGYLLNDFLYRGMAKATSFANPIDACEYYDFPKSAPMQWLVPALKLGYPDISAVADPKTYIEDYRVRLQKATAENPDYMKTHDCLGTLLCAYDPFPDKGTAAFDNMAAQFTMCAKSGPPRHEFAGYGASNLKPELSDAAAASSSPLSVAHPRAVAAAPSWEFFDKGMDKGLDQEVPEFTSRAFFPAVCHAYGQQHGGKDHKADWISKPQTGVSQITYLSDGFCGSTCSVSTTRPVLEGLASVVTYGGINGVPTDITSFNGGNLNGNYQGLFDDLFKTLIEAAVHNPEHPKPGREAIMLPLPWATSEVKFAQRAQYPTVLGDHALPREWYKVPAPNHIDAWTSGDLTFTARGRNPEDPEQAVMGLITPDEMVTIAGLYEAAAKKEYRALVPPAAGRTLADGESLAKCPAGVPFGKHGAACASDDDCDVTSSCACVAAGGARELLFAATPVVAAPRCVCK